MADCELKKANGVDARCDGEGCMYWRVAAHLGLAEDDFEGCAIQHFELLEGGESIAAWLLSVKDRIETARPGAA